MKETEEEESFLGAGWSFPPEFSKKTSSVQLVKDTDDIKQSLTLLLSTRQGERVMQPDFGCDLSSLVFEELTTTIKTLMKDQIETAVLYFEPRIRLTNVLIEDNKYEGAIQITLEFIVKATNSRSNLVYPFYLKEATDAL